MGYASALLAGVLWGTTGPLSTALYAEGARLTGVGFWRIGLAVAVLAVLALVRPRSFRMDGRGLLAVGLGGAALGETLPASAWLALAMILGALYLMRGAAPSR